MVMRFESPLVYLNETWYYSLMQNYSNTNISDESDTFYLSSHTNVITIMGFQSIIERNKEN